MQESDQDRPSQPESDGGLRNRLDELTRPEMERVLERAIRIHAERTEAQTFTRQQVDQVAAELGLPHAVVEKAMEEELTATDPVEDIAAWPFLGPKRLVARTTVEASDSEVTDRVMTWLEGEEGLRPLAPVVDGVRWERDSHWTTGARLALGSDGTKAIRGMRETTHRLTSAAEDRQIVELDVDTALVRMTAGWTGMGIGVAGVAGGVAVAVGFDGGNDLAQFASVAVPGMAAGLATTVTIGKVWATSVRKGLQRALDGIAHPELYPRAARRREKRQAVARRRSSVERLVDEVSDALDRLLD